MMINLTPQKQKFVDSASELFGAGSIINKQQVKVEEEVGEEADNSKSNFTSTTLNVNEIEVVENIITEIYELLLFCKKTF